MAIEIDHAPDHRLAASLSRLLLAAAGLIVEAPARHGLTLTQLRCLLYIAAHRNATASGLARHLGTHRSTVSGVVERLAQRGLVERRHQPDDRRVTLLRVTEEASALLGLSSSVQAASLNGDHGGVQAQHVDPVVRLLDRLAGALSTHAVAGS